MSDVRLQIPDGRNAFEPFEEIQVNAAWKLDSPVRWLELRLTWYTRGKGTADVQVVATHRLDKPHVEGSYLWNLRLPAAPYSFSGKLISLVWTLEIVDDTEELSARQDIVIAPLSREILLHAEAGPLRAAGK